MKKVIKKISWWLVMPFFMILFLVSCLNQKKNIESSKNEISEKKQEESSTKTETKTEQESSGKSSVKIVDSTLRYITATMHYSFVATIGVFTLLSIAENDAKIGIPACVTLVRILNMKIKKIEDLNEKTE